MDELGLAFDQIAAQLVGLGQDMGDGFSDAHQQVDLLSQSMDARLQDVLTELGGVERTEESKGQLGLDPTDPPVSVLFEVAYPQVRWVRLTIMYRYLPAGDSLQINAAPSGSGCVMVGLIGGAGSGLGSAGTETLEFHASGR
jgi:hypothetical protein